MTFSLVLNHAAFRPERRVCLRRMLTALDPERHGYPFFLNDQDHRSRPWSEAKVEWMYAQWAWSVRQETDWHLFCTDDLDLAPEFLGILEAILTAAKDEQAIGFLSNHPRALTVDGRWYRTNSWIVGPMYAVKHDLLVDFLPWYEALDMGPSYVPRTKRWYNDDMAINDFITAAGRSSVHPLPTPIEHRADLGSMLGHGDRTSRERLSWRCERSVVDGEAGHFAWVERPRVFGECDMANPAWWGDPKEAPLMKVGE